jgi:membrane-associated phospholipid phosphatase
MQTKNMKTKKGKQVVDKKKKTIVQNKTPTTTSTTTAIPWNLAPAPTSNPVLMFDYELTRFLLHHCSLTIPRTTTRSSELRKKLFTGLWKCLSYSNHILLYIISFPILFTLSTYLYEDENGKQLMSSYRNRYGIVVDIVLSLLQPLCIKFFYLALSIDLIFVTAAKKHIQRIRPFNNPWFHHPTTTFKARSSVYSLPSGEASRSMIFCTCLVLWFYNILPNIAVPDSDVSMVVIASILATFLWSVFVGIASVCLGNSFILDILCGWILGVSQVLTALWIKQSYKLFE